MTALISNFVRAKKVLEEKTPALVGVNNLFETTAGKLFLTVFSFLAFTFLVLKENR